jgi:hypothetical protein
VLPLQLSHYFKHIICNMHIHGFIILTEWDWNKRIAKEVATQEVMDLIYNCMICWTKKILIYNFSSISREHSNPSAHKSMQLPSIPSSSWYRVWHYKRGDLQLGEGFYNQQAGPGNRRLAILNEEVLPSGPVPNQLSHLSSTGEPPEWGWPLPDDTLVASATCLHHLTAVKGVNWWGWSIVARVWLRRKRFCLLWLVATEEAGIVRLVERLPASAQNLESCMHLCAIFRSRGEGWLVES